MINKRYMSCLLDIKQKDLMFGTKEINKNFKDKINFEDILKCVAYKKIIS